jgi:hypothetical protein
MKQVILLFIFTLTLCASALAQNSTDNTFTITTYYPSPYGVYRNMRFYPSNLPSEGVDRGVMYFNQTNDQLYVYQNGTTRWQPLGIGLGVGYWMQSGNNIYYNITGGNVGIGTSTPSQKLEVVGGNFSLPSNGAIFYLPEVTGNTAYTGLAASNGFMTDGVPWYFGIGREYGAWVNPYPDLVIHHHTGVRLAAHSNYGGISFFEALNPAGSAWSSSGTEIARFRDNRYGGSYFLSSLGVGTSTLPARLTVLSPGGAADAKTFSMREGNNPTYGWDFTVDDLVDGDLIINRVNAGTASPMMTFQRNTGNVGIGLTAVNPAHALEVRGNIVNMNPSLGYLALTGDLTGYAVNTYPTLKTNGQYIYFDAGATYTGYIGFNTGFVDVCDGRLKKNIRKIEGALDKLSQINGVTFVWKDGRDNNKEHIGVIAQDVEKVVPQLVSQPEGIETKGVAYSGLSALAIEAIKELKERVEQLEAKLAVKQRQAE